MAFDAGKLLVMAPLLSSILFLGRNSRVYGFHHSVGISAGGVGMRKHASFCTDGSLRLMSFGLSSNLSRIKCRKSLIVTALRSTTTSSSVDAIGTDSSSLIGINNVREAIATVLNEEFDYKEVAKNAALGKLQKKKKKKKAKNKGDSEEDENNQEKPFVDLEAVAEKAMANAKPFSLMDTMVTPATKLEFGDYQCNAAMGLAKNVQMQPRDCAAKIIEGLLKQPGIADVLEEPEIAGPGFINLRLKEDYLANSIKCMAADASERMALPKVTGSAKQKVVIDYSSPNIAKEMHVGHLRSTIIGDTLANLLEFVGHDVVRLNHVGDWGTQFGMLVEHLRDEYPAALSKETSQDVDLGDLVQLYKAAKKRFDVDEDFKVRAREGVVDLQGGNAESLAAWESLCAASRVEFQKIYDTLNIKGLEERGESFYNSYLNDVVSELEEKGLAVESEGATAVFLDGYTNRDGTPLPMLVRKSDGGFNYATTDLAAIKHRVNLSDGENADRVLYVTDAGQSQHFQMVFEAAKLAGFVTDNISLEHVPFGLVQGEDGKKFATRSGDTVKLRDLLVESVRIAGEDVRSRMEDPEGDFDVILQNVAQTVGIGAVKYADLSMNRESNYKFSYDRMLSLNGNTAPYMLYAYARLCGIIRKATSQEDATSLVWPEGSDVIITHESELQLVRSLVRLPDILSEVETELYPNRLCDYLFETSQKFNQFYENCSVNNAETAELKASRLTLCTVTASTIRLLLSLIGIPTLERL